MEQITLVGYYYYFNIHIQLKTAVALNIVILMVHELFQKEVLRLSHLWRDRIEYCIPVIMGLMIQLQVAEQLVTLVEIKCTQC